MPDSAARRLRRHKRRGAPTRAILTSSLAGVLLLPLLTVPPAYSAPASGAADIPADPVDWPSAPYSPLVPEQLAAARNGDGDVELTFDGKGTGLPAADGQGTGFTTVLPSSAADSAPYFVPDGLALSEGRLKMAASNGSPWRGSNNLD